MGFSCNTTRRFSGAHGQSWSWSFSAICLLWDLQEAKSRGPFIAGCYGTIDKLFQQSREMEYLPLGVKPFTCVDHVKPTWYLRCRKLGFIYKRRLIILCNTHTYTHTHTHTQTYIYVYIVYIYIDIYIIQNFFKIFPLIPLLGLRTELGARREVLLSFSYIH